MQTNDPLKTAKQSWRAHLRHVQMDKEVAEQHDGGNSYTFSEKSAWLGAHVKGLYNNTHTTGSKQKKFMVCEQLQCHDHAGMTEMCFIKKSIKYLLIFLLSKSNTLHESLMTTLFYPWQ